jgi:hypothetical protein
LVQGLLGADGVRVAWRRVALMNHKRGRPKNRRAGCLMCKPHKMNGLKGQRRKRTHGSWSNRRQEVRANVSAKEQGAL